MQPKLIAVSKDKTHLLNGIYLGCINGNELSVMQMFDSVAKFELQDTIKGTDINVIVVAQNGVLSCYDKIVSDFTIQTLKPKSKLTENQLKTLIGFILYDLAEAGALNDLGIKIAANGGKLSELERNGFENIKATIQGFLDDIEENSNYYNEDLNN